MTERDRQLVRALQEGLPLIARPYAEVARRAGWTEPDYQSLAGYEAAESSCDGLDNDCNGKADDIPAAVAPLADRAVGLCTDARKVCAGGRGWVEPDYARIDGYEATEVIRSARAPVLDRNIPVIAMTANAMQGDREKCLEAGMNDYIAKPVDSATLTEVLDRWLPRRGE